MPGSQTTVASRGRISCSVGDDALREDRNVVPGREFAECGEFLFLCGFHDLFAVPVETFLSKFSSDSNACSASFASATSATSVL